MKRTITVIIFFTFLFAFSAKAAVISNCKTEKRIQIAGCGYAHGCTNTATGEAILKPFIYEESGGWSYKLFADGKTVILIRGDGHEVKWVHDYDRNIDVNILDDRIWASGRFTSFSVFFGNLVEGWNDPSNGGNFFYSFRTEGGMFMDIGRCE